MGVFRDKIGSPADELEWHQELLELTAKYAREDAQVFAAHGIEVHIDLSQRSISFVGTNPDEKDQKIGVTLEPWEDTELEETELLWLTGCDDGNLVDWSIGHDGALQQIAELICKTFELRPRSSDIDASPKWS